MHLFDCALRKTILGGLVAIAVVTPAFGKRYRDVPVGITPVDAGRIGSEPDNGVAQEPPLLVWTGSVAVFAGRTADLPPLPTGSHLNLFLGATEQNAPTILITSNATGDSPGNGDSFGASLASAYGPVLFTSLADNLVELDDNGTSDIFYASRLSGRLALASTSATRPGASANGASYDAAWGWSGIAFVSDATDIRRYSWNRGGNLYLDTRDPWERDIRLVSATPEDREGNGPTRGRPANAASSPFIAFASEASDLVAEDSNGHVDVFLRDVERSRTTLVSAAGDGSGSGDGDSELPAISDNGRFVVFVSDASNLVPGDENGARDVLVYDRRRRRTRLVSVRLDGKGSGNGASDTGWSSGAPVITPDGRFVAFVSRATDLVREPAPGQSNVYVRDLRRGRTWLASAFPAGTPRETGASSAPAISCSGRFVAFTSDAAELPAGSRAPFGIYVRDRRRRATEFVHDTALREAVSSPVPRSKLRRHRSDNHVFGFATGYATGEGSVFVVRVR